MNGYNRASLEQSIWRIQYHRDVNVRMDESGYTRQDRLKNTTIRDKIGVVPLQKRWQGFVLCGLDIIEKICLSNGNQMENSPIVKAKTRKTIGQTLKRDLEVSNT